VWQLDLFRELPPDEVIQVTGHVCEGNRKLLKLEITISRPSVKRMRYEFSLNTDCDTAKSITTEMMEVLQLSEVRNENKSRWFSSPAQLERRGTIRSAE
jgi:hypothetical protein